MINFVVVVFIGICMVCVYCEHGS